MNRYMCAVSMWEPVSRMWIRVPCCREAHITTPCLINHETMKQDIVTLQAKGFRQVLPYVYNCICAYHSKPKAEGSYYCVEYFVLDKQPKVWYNTNTSRQVETLSQMQI